MAAPPFSARLVYKMESGNQACTADRDRSYKWVASDRKKALIQKDPAAAIWLSGHRRQSNASMHRVFAIQGQMISSVELKRIRHIHHYAKKVEKCQQRNRVKP